MNKEQFEWILKNVCKPGGMVKIWFDNDSYQDVYIPDEGYTTPEKANFRLYTIEPDIDVLATRDRGVKENQTYEEHHILSNIQKFSTYTKEERLAFRWYTPEEYAKINK